MKARITLFLVLAAVAVLGTRAVASENEYAQGDLLIEPAALAAAGKQFVVLDARKRKLYDESRIPGAVWVDAEAWAKAFHDGKDAKGWSARIGGLGVTSKSKVVIYDDHSLNDAARMWWILRFWGVEHVRLLNGNWIGWKHAKLPVETQKPRPPKPAQFTAEPHPQRLVTQGPLLGSLKQKSLQIVDARSKREFCGVDARKNKRAGAIPGAKHLEWTDLIDKQSQRFKSPAELRKLFRAARIELDKPTATYCQSGGRASVMAFAMELMGAENVSNYYASWGEWGNAKDTPIVVDEKAIQSERLRKEKEKQRQKDEKKRIEKEKK